MQWAGCHQSLSTCLVTSATGRGELLGAARGGHAWKVQWETLWDPGLGLLCTYWITAPGACFSTESLLPWCPCVILGARRRKEEFRAERCGEVRCGFLDCQGAGPDHTQLRFTRLYPQRSPEAGACRGKQLEWRTWGPGTRSFWG